MPQAPTAHGLPRPANSDKLRDGWDAISDLADAVDTWLPLSVTKPAQTDRTNTVALANDPHLFLDLPVGTFRVNVGLSASGATTNPDLKVAYVNTGTMNVLNRAQLGPETAMTTVAAALMRSATTNGLAATASYGLSSGGTWVTEELIIQVTVAGRLTLQWSQNTLDAANASSLRAGCYMTAQRIA